MIVNRYDLIKRGVAEKKVRKILKKARDLLTEEEMYEVTGVIDGNIKIFSEFDFYDLTEAQEKYIDTVSERHYQSNRDFLDLLYKIGDTL